MPAVMPHPYRDAPYQDSKIMALIVLVLQFPYAATTCSSIWERHTSSISGVIVIVTELCPSSVPEISLHHRSPLEVPCGLFVGSIGSLGLPYLRGTSYPLRDCPYAATLNGCSLLWPLTPDVREGCAEEFSAGEDVALGFSGPHSLAAVPAWGTEDEGTLELTLTTQSQQAPLAFQAGDPPGEFIHLDIFEGHLWAVVEKGQGTALLLSSVPVADRQPHKISVHINIHQLEISMDQHPTCTSNRGVLSYLEPRGSLLLGGWLQRPLVTSRNTAQT
ncbi:hypothetical protein H8959_014888 [Pygathrix nigripes]